MNIENIVAMDIEYGGGRTVPRVAIVNFHEQVLYYTDFCMRYEDWTETKITEAAEADEIVEKDEHSKIYQNAYVKKRPLFKKNDPNIDEIPEATQEDDLYSDDKSMQIKNTQDMERIEREEMEDEEL